MARITVTDLAAQLSACWAGDPRLILSGVATLADATPNELSFLADRRYRTAAMITRAAVILAKPGDSPLPPDRVLEVTDPHAALYEALVLFYPSPPPKPMRSRRAVISPQARVAKSARVEPFATIGAETEVGAGTTVSVGARVGNGAQIGNRTFIGANAVVEDGVRIGNRVHIGPGSVVGSIGFGFANTRHGAKRLPHVGCVIIEDDVEIGANCTVDRATLGTTVIGRWSKLDNLVHVAHNVVIGERVLVAAQCGFAGSTFIGDDVHFGGQAGVAGHVTIASGSRIAAKTGVMKSSGGALAGHPARHIILQRRAEARLLHLDDLVHRVRALEHERQQHSKQ
jgi:UDP-3-O-[3-hydroxymyristoyl] glucosamine N-acyltransferase